MDTYLGKMCTIISYIFFQANNMFGDGAGMFENTYMY